MSKFDSLCAAKEGASERAGLYPCNATYPRTYNPIKNYGRWDLNDLRQNINGEGTMMLAGNSKLCLTVMKCDSTLGDNYCNSDSSEAAYDLTTGLVDDLRRGSYLRFKTCYNANGGTPGLKAIQLWRQKLDCAAGCPPMLQENDVCDEVCNVAKCNFDNGACITQSPTRPTTKTTPAPTGPTMKSPTFKFTPAPTPKVTASLAPTFRGDTRAPTIPTPTASPTITCPQNGEIEYCNRWRKSQKRCTTIRRAKRLCTWCLNSCRPKADPRVCTVPGLYDECKPVCPSLSVRRRCARAQTKSQCIGRGKTPCTYCASTQTCNPGRDGRICQDPNLYSHCPTTPVVATCPTHITLNRCHNRDTLDTCMATRGCTWCENASVRKCRLAPPTSPVIPNYCQLGDDYILKAFPSCPNLLPTTTG